MPNITTNLASTKPKLFMSYVVVACPRSWKKEHVPFLTMLNSVV